MDVDPVWLHSMQVALGELTYENEARDRSRVDLKAARAELQQLQTSLTTCQVMHAHARTHADRQTCAHTQLNLLYSRNFNWQIFETVRPW